MFLRKREGTKNLERESYIALRGELALTAGLVLSEDGIQNG